MKADTAWLDDPRIYQVNRLPAHSDHRCFADAAEAAAGCSSLERSLDGEWNFRYLPTPEIPEGFGGVDFSLENFGTILVPGHIELAGYHQIQYTNSDYPWEGKIWRRPAGTICTIEEAAGDFSQAEDNPVGLYVRDILWEPEREDDRAVLCLYGAEQAVYVWVNGTFVGYAEDSFTPSEFDITKAVTPGSNRLSIAVFRHGTASWMEDQDFFRFFGLYRSVVLRRVPSLHLEDLHVITGCDPAVGTGSLRADLKLRTAGAACVRVRLLDPAGVIVREMQTDAQPELSVDLGDLGRVCLWDYGHPSLYTLEISLSDASGERELSTSAVGFRRLAIIGGVIHLNGHRLMLCGVNRHEWSAERGRSITEENMKEDIGCLLRNNINAVRTCHYPDQLMWYRLCDEAGIYVMAEMNLEAHGSWQKYGVGVDRSWNVPGSFEAYRGAILDRAISNYETFKNHPSVLFWSLGNESCAGDVLRDANRYFKEKDPERLTHYESVFYTPEYRDQISDVESRMYASPEDVSAYLENDPDKPYVLCEFMHDMGNSMGGLKDYMDLFERYPMYHGGFIWDMIDQALWAEDEVTGRKVLRYGGDFDERHSDLEFSGNGILFADRTEKPCMQEVRELYGRYASLGIDGVCENPADGCEKGCMDLSVGEKESAEGQSAEPLHLVFGDSVLGVRGSRMQWMFSYAFGGPESLIISGTEWIFRAPRPTFWRATTCNDRGSAFSEKSAMWLGADMFSHCAGVDVIRDGVPMDFPGAPGNNALGGDQTAETVELVYHFRTATVPSTEVTVAYRVSGGGECRVTVHYFGKEGLPELPVLGLRMIAPTAADHFRYEGLSGETYPDRMEGGVPGIYEVEGMPVSGYMVPQECGMHMETRWVEIHRSTSRNNAVGRRADTTLRILMDPEPLGFSCLPYTAEELENAWHPEELPPARRTVLCVCGRVRGVGGINSWGADVRESRRIPADMDHEFSFVIDGVC